MDRKAKQNTVKRRAKAANKKNLRLRDSKSIRYNDNIQPTTDFVKFATNEILPNIKLDGNRIELQKKTAIKCLFQLVQADLINHTIADSRDHATIGRMRISVWDAIIDAKLAIKCTGSEASKQVTRYQATPKLVTLNENWPPKMLNVNAEDAGLIVINDPSFLDQFDQPISSRVPKVDSIRDWYEQAWGKDNPNCDYEDNSYFEAVENAIESINDNNLNHSWKAFKTVKGSNGKPRKISFQPNVTYRQIHSKMPFRATRLYTVGILGGQSLNEQQRKHMLIDGEHTAELDYKGHQLRMAYHQKKKNCPDDPYQPEIILPKFHSFMNMSAQRRKEVRTFVKFATLIMMNCHHYGQAVKAVNNFLKKSSQEVKTVITKLEKCSVKDLIDRIEQTHPEICDLFYTGAGLELMTIDGKIILHILRECVKAEIPALAVHDSLVVKQEDIEFAEQTMRHIYKQFFPHNWPVISRVF